MRHKILIAFLLFMSIIITFSTVYVYADEGNGVIKGKINVKVKKYKKDTVVYIERVEGDFPPPEEHAKMDQIELTFIPHVLVVLKGTTVDFKLKR